MMFRGTCILLRSLKAADRVLKRGSGQATGFQGARESRFHSSYHFGGVLSGDYSNRN